MLSLGQNFLRPPSLPGDHLEILKVITKRDEFRRQKKKIKINKTSYMYLFLFDFSL